MTCDTSNGLSRPAPRSSAISFHDPFFNPCRFIKDSNSASSAFVHFRDGLLEEPQYTRPAEYEGWSVPDVLLSGDHAKIAAWRQRQREERTRERRPDLWERRGTE